jgi:ABC-type nitrate/sulfonate/bicarbonate transport system substrate-binding protein
MSFLEVSALARVLKVYDQARVWIGSHPDETAKIISAESKVSLPVAKLQLSRNDFSQPQPGARQIDALNAIDHVYRRLARAAAPARHSGTSKAGSR